jgi:hypothetical protein
LSCFHVTTNYALDAKHYLLNGIIPHELQCILPVFVKKGFGLVGKPQSLIVNFSYRLADQNSKPFMLFMWSGIADEMAKEEVDRMKNLSSTRHLEILDRQTLIFSSRGETHESFIFTCLCLQQQVSNHT